MSSQFPVLGRLLGLEREKAIADSGIRNIFTPHQPISEVDLLFGRTDEVRRLVATLNTPGQHVLVYGERGVGKSSLVNVVSSLAAFMMDRTLFEKRCDQSDTFESILRGPLAEVGADLTLIGATEQEEKHGEGDLKFVRGGMAKTITGTYAASHSLSPSTVAEAIRDINGLLVIDEVDAIGNAEDRRKLAELIKLLSDAGSTFKIMLSGIAATGAELIAAHPSVQRCLRETKLERMSEAELTEIVTNGAEAAKLKFAPKVVAAIARLSAGYPHFTHLIALKCAEEAVVDGRTDVNETHLRQALKLAVKDAEGTLQRDYETATRSATTDMYKNIVIAAASFHSQEFSASELRDAIQALTGRAISQGSLNNFLVRLVSNDGASILHRTAKGVYRFSDPRMASYARMVHSTL